MTNYLLPDAPAVDFGAPDWHADAACAGIVDDHLWFPRTSGDTQHAMKEARRICGGCNVRTRCLESAVDNFEHGIWAATTQEQRVDMRRRAS